MIYGTKEYEEQAFHMRLERYTTTAKMQLKGLKQALDKAAFWISLVAGTIAIIQVIV